MKKFYLILALAILTAFVVGCTESRTFAQADCEWGKKCIPDEFDDDFSSIEECVADRGPFLLEVFTLAPDCKPEADAYENCIAEFVDNQECNLVGYDLDGAFDSCEDVANKVEECLERVLGDAYDFEDDYLE